MIVFDLECRTNGHRFEGWFGSSDDFAEQQARGLIACPMCNSADVARAISAPNIGRKSNQHTEPARQTVLPAAPAPAPAPAPAAHANTPLPPQAVAALKAIAKIQAEALKTSTWVGKRFADNARAMHYGETDAAPIHGEATPQEAQALHEEGVSIAPILFPIAPPKDLN
ncbi:DUF1178 family protein [Novosphingobium sp.]|uniref:DUF1178 family protein n=1 Tax=Novosphingobium sp. TaxID=1874826 RepID=UPI003D0ED9D4